MDPDPSLRSFAQAVGRPGDEIDLARVAFLIARIEHADLDVVKYLGRLDELAGQAPAGAHRGDPIQRLHRLREYVFEELGFSGNREDYYDPRNSFLNEVLDRRLGIPITLAVTLMEIGRRVGLALDGVGLPGHFIVRMQLSDSRILLDPFDGGSVLTPDACVDLVERAVGRRVPLEEAAFRPVAHREIVARMLRNLKGAYWQRTAWAQVVRVIDRLLLVDPAAGAERRDRGLALAQLGEYGPGAADWERYLTEFPNAPDGEKVRGHLRRVRQKLAELN